jgi:hypothetical protein
MHRHDEDDESELSAQRLRNRLLASRLRKTQTVSDQTVADLLIELESAKAALYAIWESADQSCEPQDHEEIVQYVTTAIAAYRADCASKEPQY